MENPRLLDILKTAILLELRGEAFYRKVSESTNNADIKNIFDIMANEEVLHARVLRDKYAEAVRHNKITSGSLPDDQHESAVFYVLQNR
jgi:rubrerythrin